MAANDQLNEAINVRIERRAEQAAPLSVLASQTGTAQADRTEIVQVITQSGVSSLAGTANQIAASVPTGAVVISHVPETGWTAGTGTANKGAFATYAGQTVSAAYVQAEAQQTDDKVKANSQRIKALEDALRSRGLIN